MRKQKLNINYNLVIELIINPKLIAKFLPLRQNDALEFLAGNSPVTLKEFSDHMKFNGHLIYPMDLINFLTALSKKNYIAIDLSNIERKDNDKVAASGKKGNSYNSSTKF